MDIVVMDELAASPGVAAHHEGGPVYFGRPEGLSLRTGDGPKEDAVPRDVGLVGIGIWRSWCAGSRKALDYLSEGGVSEVFAI